MSDFFTTTDFLKRLGEYKKIHAQDNLQLLVADGSQVLQDDGFLDLCVGSSHSSSLQVLAV